MHPAPCWIDAATGKPTARGSFLTLLLKHTRQHQRLKKSLTRVDALKHNSLVAPGVVDRH